MSYIGRGIDQIDNISTLDNLTFNGSDTVFNLTQNSVAFNIISVSALQIQIDGIIQVGNFTQTGASQIQFNFTPNANSVCNGIKHFGVGVAFTPSSGSVTKDKTNFVSTSSSAGLEIKGDGTTDGTLQLNCSQNSHGIKIKSAPHSANASYTLTLPNTDGNADQVLKTDGSGVLDWTTPSSGGLVVISNYNVSSTVSTITFDNVFTSTYKNYLIITSNVKVSSTAKTLFNFRSGGSSLTGNYNQAMTAYRTANNAIEYGNANQTNFTTTIANDIYQDTGYSERMYIYDPKNSADKRISQLGVYNDSNQYDNTFMGTGVYANNTTSIDGFILSRSSGDFYGHGQITIYGIKNA